MANPRPRRASRLVRTSPITPSGTATGTNAKMPQTSAATENPSVPPGGGGGAPDEGQGGDGAHGCPASAAAEPPSEPGGCGAAHSSWFTSQPPAVPCGAPATRPVVEQPPSPSTRLFTRSLIHRCTAALRVVRRIRLPICAAQVAGEHEWPRAETRPSRCQIRASTCGADTRRPGPLPPEVSPC
jgi:hypothetical protein